MTITSYRPKKTATTVVQCDCTVCTGLRAEVPVGLLLDSKPGTKSHRNIVHNLVCIAWSPVGIGANCTRLPRLAEAVATPDITGVSDRDSWTSINGRTFTHPGIPGWIITVVSPRRLRIEGLVDGMTRPIGTATTWAKAIDAITALHAA